ncbi:unnamed protein product [Scytosiphon promiscuus]
MCSASSRSFARSIPSSSSSMFSLAGIAATCVFLLLVPKTHGFLSSPALPTRSRTPAHAACPPRPTRAAVTTTMSYAPQNVQDVWDNHFAAFGAQDVDRILLDYDESSVIMTFDQTTDKKEVYEGVEGARTLFEGLFGTMVDQSDLAAPMIEVSEDSSTIFLVWRNPASGFLDATDTFVLNNDTRKIFRQNVAFKTG